MTPESAYDLFGTTLGSALPVDERRTRFGDHGRRAWWLKGKEIAPERSEGWIDVKLPNAVHRALQSDARVRFRSGKSEWLEYLLTTRADVDFLVDLFRRNYHLSPT